MDTAGQNPLLTWLHVNVEQVRHSKIHMERQTDVHRLGFARLNAGLA